MKLYAPTFERRLRQRLRPAWRAARRQRSPGERFWHRHRSFPRWLGIVFVALMAAACFRGLTAKWTLEAATAYIGLFLTVLMIIAAPLARMGVVPSERFTTLLWLPVADEDIARLTWQGWWRQRCYATLAFSVVLIGYRISLDWTLELARWPALLALSLLAAGAFTGLAMVPLRLKDWGVTLLLLVGLFAGPQIPGTVRWLPHFLSAYGPALNWLHPGGWIMALWHSAAMGTPWGAATLLGLPLLTLAGSSRYWYRCHRAWCQSPALLDQWSTQTATAEMEKAALVPNADTRAAALKGLRVAWCPPVAGRWSQWLTGRLTARERMLLETLGADFPRVERAWRRAAFCSLGAVALALGTVCGFDLGNLVNLPLGFLALVYWGQLPLQPAVPFLSWKSALLPISYSEISRLEWKLAWPIFLLMLPPAGVFGASWAVALHQPGGEGALLGGKVLALIASLLPFLTVLRISDGSGDTSGWRWRALVIWMGAFASLASLAVGASGMFVHGWPGWLLLTAPALTAWLFRRIHQRQWNRRDFDALKSPG